MMMLPQGDPTVEHDIDDPDCYCELCKPGPESKMIEKFAADGKPIYYFKDPVTGHCPWDEDCSCEACKDLSFYEEMTGSYHQSYSPHKRRQRKSKKKSIHSQLYRRWMQGDPSVGPLGEDNGRFIFLVDYGSKSSKPELAQIPPSSTQNPPKQPHFPPSTPQRIKSENLVQPCYKKIQKWVKRNPQPESTPQLQSDQMTSVLMFQPTSPSYNKDFPPLEEFTEKEFKHAPKIPTPLHSMVETKVDSNTKIANELIVLLHKRLQQVEKQTTPPAQDLFYYLDLKEKDIQTLKEQIRMLEEISQVPQPLEEEEFFQSLRRGPPPKLQPSIFASFHKEVTSPSQSFMFSTGSAETKKPTTYEIYQQIKQLEAEKKRHEAERKRERDRKGKASQEEADPSPKASRALMVQGLSQQNPLTSFLKEYRETIIPKIVAINQDSKEEEQSLYYDNSKSSQASSDDMIMVTTSNQPEVKTENPDDTEPMDTATPATTTTFSATGAKYIFTLDDIPVSKWAQRFQEFHSWMETQKLTRESNYEILTEFVSRFTGVLRDWWRTIPPGDQMQFLVQQDFAAVIRAMHTHFLGNPDDVKTLQRKEFFKRKCCSFERKDLEKYFNAMIKLFFKLGAYQSLKQVILASILELLQNAVDRNLQQRRRNILQLTVGEIQQETFIALEELCDRKKIIKDYMSGSKELDKACKIPGLTINCKKEHQCHCRARGRKAFSRSYNKRPSKMPNFPAFPKRRGKWKYLRKKRVPRIKSSKCFLCGQKGHFAKSCPKNKRGSN
ncbi:hypothetical protein V6N11_057059 [Hibiscus sabdariffa]|uniref:CCHC-type domain-containing protein n=1 Tax=Hibiscus sabdariffa TaxID=183260 RepID=A0ABR1ZIF5_9ROSI